MPKKKPQIPKKEREAMQKMVKSPIVFIWAMWKLKPQPVRPEYENTVKELIDTNRLDDDLDEHRFFME